MNGDEGLRVLFAQAVDLPPDARAQFLGNPALSPDLRRQLHALLAADQASDTYFERAFTPEKPAAPGIDQRFGPYQTRSLLGQGGMGMVFLADRVDGEMRQTVAIKVVRQTWFDPRALDRFRNERQLLAGLVHGNIARLLDGGTRADGVPYLVMEYIDGVPLDRYAEAHALKIPARLALFLPLCDAVEYAHSRLVIHRDLKPANVLVTAQGEPKLLDFGIGKALDAAPSGETRTVTLTPDFASPEQARGEAATTATDVYGLGGVLYFLLTGHSVHSTGSLAPAEMRRLICETAPKAPALLQPELKGDLENILLKALHTEPQRRYRSVGEFRDDLHRFLDRRPVLATRDGFAYRAQRFVERNRFGSAAAALLLVVAAAGTGVSLYQARRAERRFAQVRTLANKFVFDFEAAIRRTPGTLEARRMVASTARQYLADLTADAGRDPAMKRELAESYFQLSGVEFEAGELPQSIVDGNRSLALLQEIKDDCCGSPKQRAAYINELVVMVTRHNDSRDLEQANQTSRAAVRAARTWVAQSPNLPAATLALANAQQAAGILLVEQGKPEDARLALQEAWDLAAKNLSGMQAQQVQAESGYYLSRALNSLGRSQQALAVANSSSQILERLLASDPADIQWRSLETRLLIYTGDFLDRLANSDPSFAPQALDTYRKAYTLSREGAAKNPGNHSLLDNAASSAAKLANYLANHDRSAEAIPILQEAIDDIGELVRSDPANRRYRYMEVSSGHLLGVFLYHLKRMPEAKAKLIAAKQQMDAALKNAPGDLQLLVRQAAISADLTTVYRELGNLPEARAECRQSIALAMALIARQQGAKRPLGAALATVRKEAKLLGLADPTLAVPGIE